jgi:hypothetical protein
MERCAYAEAAGAATVGLTLAQKRAWPRMGSRQHLACWPWAAQMSMKLLTSVGVVVAGWNVSLPVLINVEVYEAYG